MEKTYYINKNVITHVEAIVDCLEWQYIWRNGFKIWNYQIIKPHYYDRINNIKFTEQELLSNKFDNKNKYYIKNKNVYHNPHVTIYISDKKHTLYFETPDELKGFIYNNGFTNVNWIINGIVL